MENEAEEALQRMGAIPESTSDLKIFFPIITEKSVTLSDVRRAYLSLCLRVHRENGGSDDVEFVTRCTQKILKVL